MVNTVKRQVNPKWEINIRNDFIVCKSCRELIDAITNLEKTIYDLQTKNHKLNDKLIKIPRQKDAIINTIINNFVFCKSCRELIHVIINLEKEIYDLQTENRKFTNKPIEIPDQRDAIISNLQLQIEYLKTCIDYEDSLSQLTQIQSQTLEENQKNIDYLSTNLDIANAKCNNFNKINRSLQRKFDIESNEHKKCLLLLQSQSQCNEQLEKSKIEYVDKLSTLQAELKKLEIINKDLENKLSEYSMIRDENNKKLEKRNTELENNLIICNEKIKKLLTKIKIEQKKNQELYIENTKSKQQEYTDYDSAFMSDCIISKMNYEDYMSSWLKGANFPLSKKEVAYINDKLVKMGKVKNTDNMETFIVSLNKDAIVGRLKNLCSQMIKMYKNEVEEHLKTKSKYLIN